MRCAKPVNLGGVHRIARTRFQAAEPAVGCRAVSTLPLASTATHNAIEGHETPSSRGLLLESMDVVLHAEAPAVGSLDVTTSSWLSVATHSRLPAQEIDVSAVTHDVCGVQSLTGSTVAAVHRLDREVGSVEVTMLPRLSTATHKDRDGHDTPWNDARHVVVQNTEAPGP
jgi:hypothetical protein